MTQLTKRTVGILVFPEVEVLDFCGPFEVFSVASDRLGQGELDVRLVGLEPGPIRAAGGLRVLPDHTLAHCPAVDLLLVPGGQGTRPLLHHAELIAWLADRGPKVELLLSVCTGALLLAKAGQLKGLRATTHHKAFDLLRQVAPGVQVVTDRRMVDNGRVICSAGIAAGIDMALHVVARLLGNERAQRTAEHMEYPWQGSPPAEWA